MSQLANVVRSRFPCSEETDLDTPLPGRRASSEEREAALKRILLMVADEQRAVVEDVPLRCSFASPSTSLAPRDLVAPVVILIERTGWCQVCASAEDVQDYFDTRKPWETYDYYCLEVNGRRCVCVTHDEEILAYGSGSDCIASRATDV